MDRVKQFLMARPLLERRPPADTSGSPPMAAPAPPSIEPSAGQATSASPSASSHVPRDRRRDLLLMLMLLRTIGRRT